MRRIFTRGTNTLAKISGEYSFSERIPSQKYGENILVRGQLFSQKCGASIICGQLPSRKYRGNNHLWTNTLPTNVQQILVGRILPVDEYIIMCMSWLKFQRVVIFMLLIRVQLHFATSIIVANINVSIIDIRHTALRTILPKSVAVGSTTKQNGFGPRSYL